MAKQSDTLKASIREWGKRHPELDTVYIPPDGKSFIDNAGRIAAIAICIVPIEGEPSNFIGAINQGSEKNLACYLAECASQLQAIVETEG